MVSFQCDACGDVVKKPKLGSHRCQSSFTCLDCSTTFATPMDWKSHSSCITEAQKYEKGSTTTKKPNVNLNGNHQRQQAPSHQQYQQQHDPSRRRLRGPAMTGPNVMVPSAGMRIWGSSNTSPEPVTDTPSETTGKRKYDATEAHLPDPKRSKKEKKAKLPQTVERALKAESSEIRAVSNVQNQSGSITQTSTEVPSSSIVPVSTEEGREESKKDQKKKEMKEKKEVGKAERKAKKALKAAEALAAEPTEDKTNRKAEKAKKIAEKEARQKEKEEKHERRLARRLRRKEKQDRKAREAPGVAA